MEPVTDLIVDISESRERFFGCAGKMLIPCRPTVEALLKEIPCRQLLTTDLLRRELAKRHGVQVTCPSAARQVLRALSRDAGCEAPYWRVVKKNGELIADFPGGLPGHAARLAEEGFTTETTGARPRVRDVTENLVRFDTE